MEEEEGKAAGAGKKPFNRWIVVVGAIMIQLALGAIYSWSVFTPELTGPDFNFTTTQTQIIFSAGLVTFALVMVLAGKLQAKHGPRKVALAGGVLLGAGYIAASMVGSSFLGLLVTIGIIGGAGIGLAYVVPIAVGIKWFPDKKGLISGLAVAGFGFGATIWVKLAGSWGNLIESQGVHSTFFIYGIIFFAMVVIGAFLMTNPPAGYSPPGWTPPQTKDKKAKRNLKPKHMLKTKQFWMVWGMFISGALAGLMVIGIIKLYGIDAHQASGKTTIEACAIAGTAMAVFYAIFNGIGRIVWGSVADKIGPKRSLVSMFSFQAVMMFAFFSMGGNEYTLYLAAALIGFNFGGNFALFPTTTAEIFGTKHVGQNYGYVFTAYGVGGVAGPMMAGYFKDAGTAGAAVDAWLPAFIIAGVLCVVAVVLALMLNTEVQKPSRKRSHSARPGSRSGARQGTSSTRTSPRSPPRTPPHARRPRR
ncbi:MAG: OFA family MFS transporter [Thermoplasmata archaeon]|nr:OFA family MFS transporter [Thermoplasmata archaeon]